MKALALQQHDRVGINGFETAHRADLFSGLGFHVDSVFGDTDQSRDVGCDGAFVRRQLGAFRVDRAVEVDDFPASFLHGGEGRLEEDRRVGPGPLRMDAIGTCKFAQPPRFYEYGIARWPYWAPAWLRSMVG